MMQIFQRYSLKGNNNIKMVLPTIIPQHLFYLWTLEYPLISWIPFTLRHLYWISLQLCRYWRRANSLWSKLAVDNLDQGDSIWHKLAGGHCKTVQCVPHLITRVRYWNALSVTSNTSKYPLTLPCHYCPTRCDVSLLLRTWQRVEKISKSFVMNPM